MRSTASENLFLLSRSINRTNKKRLEYLEYLEFLKMKILWKMNQQQIVLLA